MNFVTSQGSIPKENASSVLANAEVACVKFTVKGKNDINLDDLNHSFWRKNFNGQNPPIKITDPKQLANFLAGRKAL